MKASFICCSVMLASYPCVSAWGILGHATIAQIASNYLTAQAKTYVAGLLGPGVTMPSISSYADDYRYTTAGKFSAPYHFIDAEDNPPSACSVDLNRDCGTGGCVVSAIANYVGSFRNSLSSLPRLDMECRKRIGQSSEASASNRVKRY